MLKKDLTVMVFSDHSSAPRKFSVSRKLIRAGVITLTLLVVGLGGYSYYVSKENLRLSRMALDINKNETLTAEEVEKQRKDIKKIAVNIKSFKDELAELRALDKKIRMVTALGDNENLFGVGGQEEKDFVNIDDLIEEGDTGPALSFLSEDMNQLKELSKSQKDSFVEVDKFLKEQSSILASTPSIWPVRGWVSSGFGYRVSPFTGMRTRHEGLDIVARVGTPIVSPAAGVVVRAEPDASFGNVVEVKHGYGIVTRYGHTSSMNVKPGDKVKRGQVIASVGSTGRSTGPHLHYEVLLNGVPINPQNYIFN